MNINNKEFSEIFPLNPPQGGYSFRKGFPIVQFQIANQAKLLDGRSLRLNGDITLYSPADLKPDNTTGISPSASQETGIAFNNRVGVASCIHQITTSTLSNQTLETIRSYGRFLATTLPITHSQPDFDGALAQTNAANASRSYNGARASNVTTGFSIPLRTGLFTGGNLIPLGQNGVQGLNINLELGADSNVLSGYTAYNEDGEAQPIMFNPVDSGAYYVMTNLSLSYNLLVPDGEGQSQMTIPTTGQLTYNSYSQLYSVINSSDSTKVFNLGTSRTKSIFHNFIKTSAINNYLNDGFSTEKLQNAAGPAEIRRLTFIRGGTKFPLDYDLLVEPQGLNNRPQTQLLTKFVDAVKPLEKFNHSLMSLYTQTGIPGQNSFHLTPQPRLDHMLADPKDEVFGIGINMDPMSKVGVDFQRVNYAVRVVSQINGDVPNSVFTYVMAENTLTYSANGIMVQN
tara:strand:- start:2470 stop:3837 length:1368 start_codon:yes stop_codon:yes gene_type:complete